MSNDHTDMQRWELILRNRPEHDWLFKPNDGWYNASEVARGIGLSRPKVAELCKQGAVPGALWYGEDIGWRIPRAGLIEYLGRLMDQQEQRRASDAG